MGLISQSGQKLYESYWRMAEFFAFLFDPQSIAGLK